MKKIIDFLKKTKQKIGDFLFKNRFGTIMVLTGIIVAFWDFTTKFLFDGQEYPALKGVFSIFSTHNTGGAWSIFANATWLLILFSILFIVGIVVFNYFLKTKTYFYAISMGILLSGAICNLYDRIAFGYVRDFIKLEFINFPIFNIADIAICVGVALIAIYFIFIAPKIEKKQKLAVEDDTKYYQDMAIEYHDIEQEELLEQNADKQEELVNDYELSQTEDNIEQEIVELENEQTAKKISTKTANQKNSLTKQKSTNKAKSNNAKQNSLSKNNAKTTKSNNSKSTKTSNKTTAKSNTATKTTKGSKSKNITQSKKVSTDNEE